MHGILPQIAARYLTKARLPVKERSDGRGRFRERRGNMAAERVIAFSTEIWVAEGPVVRFMGFPYPTRMAIIRLNDGGLFLWSPIALTPGLQATVDALGPVRYLVAPNKLHHLFLGDWKTAYPWARMYAPPGLTRRRRDLAFDEKLTNEPPAVWSAEIDQTFVHGSFALTEAAFFHRASKTVLITDLIQCFPPDWFKGWRRWVAKRTGIVGPKPGTPIDFRTSFTNRRVLRQSIERILGWQPEHLIVAHGPLIEEDAVGYIRQALSWAA